MLDHPSRIPLCFSKINRKKYDRNILVSFVSWYSDVELLSRNVNRSVKTIDKLETAVKELHTVSVALELEKQAMEKEKLKRKELTEDACDLDNNVQRFKEKEEYEKAKEYVCSKEIDSLVKQNRNDLEEKEDSVNDISETLREMPVEENLTDVKELLENFKKTLNENKMKLNTLRSLRGKFGKG